MQADHRQSEVKNTVRTIAFYLPQFHPIPENDAWWGKGFTEWTNVVKGSPQFPGHYQPHLPADLGFYDLRVPEVREAQANLAQAYGVSGFCYYHYWFNERSVLERPFEEVLSSRRPNLPFCLCWANENWTRRWDGREGEVLLAQNYSQDDDRRHIEHLIRAFEDDRYIRIDGKPLLLVYRTELLPDARRTADVWRDHARRRGIELYLARVESFVTGVDPKSIGFDAAVEFAPDWRVLPEPRFQRSRWDIMARVFNRLKKAGVLHSGYFSHDVYSYRDVAERMLAKTSPSYRRFRSVTPSWDNSPRRERGATILHGSTPSMYEGWLRALVEETRRTFHGDEQIVFVNAWNEWGEGNHLEPDQRWGREYLEATARALIPL